MTTWRERAKARLKEIGKTQDWLSEQFEMTPGGMQKWLAGTRQPDLEDINRIAVALRCSPAWLTHGLDPQDNTDGLPNPARSVLRQLIGAERAGRLPATFWVAVAAMADSVAPATALEAPAAPQDNIAPRNGTHG